MPDKIPPDHHENIYRFTKDVIDKIIVLANQQNEQEKKISNLENKIKLIEVWKSAIEKLVHTGIFTIWTAFLGFMGYLAKIFIDLLFKNIK